jgi:autotransporter-associated beta strand protein
MLSARSLALRNALAVSALLIAALPGQAQTGTWSQATGGTYTWSNTANWTGGVIADGANNTANFTTANLTGPITVNLDTNRTIGALVFDNPTNTFSWTIGGASILTLSNSAAGGPTIAVNASDLVSTISTTVAGTQGFTKTGSGILNLTGNNTVTGPARPSEPLSRSITPLPPRHRRTRGSTSNRV